MLRDVPAGGRKHAVEAPSDRELLAACEACETNLATNLQHAMLPASGQPVNSGGRANGAG